MKVAADPHPRPAPFYRSGQRVWLATKDLPLQVHSRKLAPWFIVPFPISKVIIPLSMSLCLPRSLKVCCVSSSMFISLMSSLIVYFLFYFGLILPLLCDCLSAPDWFSPVFPYLMCVCVYISCLPFVVFSHVKRPGQGY